MSMASIENVASCHTVAEEIAARHGLSEDSQRALCSRLLGAVAAGAIPARNPDGTMRTMVNDDRLAMAPAHHPSVWMPEVNRWLSREYPYLWERRKQPHDDPNESTRSDKRRKNAAKTRKRRLSLKRGPRHAAKQRKLDTQERPLPDRLEVRHTQGKNEPLPYWSDADVVAIMEYEKERRESQRQPSHTPSLPESCDATALKDGEAKHGIGSATSGTSKKWNDARKEEARAMYAKLKADGIKDYATRTAKHYGITASRLRAVLQVKSAETRKKPRGLFEI